MNEIQQDLDKMAEEIDSVLNQKEPTATLLLCLIKKRSSLLRRSQKLEPATLQKLAAQNLRWLTTSKAHLQTLRMQLGEAKSRRQRDQSIHTVYHRTTNTATLFQSRG